MNGAEFPKPDPVPKQSLGTRRNNALKPRACPGLVCCGVFLQMLTMTVQAEDRASGDVTSEEIAWPSPKKNFSFRVTKENDTQHVFFLCEATGARSEVLDTPRWCEIKWSKDEHFFCILDHMDGHTTNAIIYGLRFRVDNAQFVKIEQVFKSPWPTGDDHHWELKRWNLDEGTALLHCRFKPNSSMEPHNKWVERDVVVLIDYVKRSQ